MLARRRLDQQQPLDKYRNLQVWILGLCMLQFVDVPQTTIWSRMRSMMGLEVAKEGPLIYIFTFAFCQTSAHLILVISLMVFSRTVREEGLVVAVATDIFLASR